jgi:hypothetical protein
MIERPTIYPFWMFIADPVLNVIHILERSGCAMAPSDIKTPLKANGFVVLMESESDLINCLNSIGYVNCNFLLTNKPDTLLVIPQSATEDRGVGSTPQPMIPLIPPQKCKDGKVQRLATYNLEMWKYMVRTFHNFADKIGCKIDVINPHLTAFAPVFNADVLTVVFYSAPGVIIESSGLARLKNVKSLFGIDIPEDSHAGDLVIPTEIPFGAQDIRDAGNLVGLLVGTTFYILNDLPHLYKGNGYVTSILEGFLLAVEPFIVNRIARESMIIRALAKDQRDTYIRMCSRRIDDTKRRAETELRNAEHLVESLSAQCVEAIRIRDLNRVVAAKMTELGLNNSYGVEYDNLFKVPNVESIRLQEDCMTIFTKTLFSLCLKDGTRRSFGKFKITITPNKLDMENMTRKVIMLDHPHQYGPGRFCWGNITSMITQLQGAYEYATLANVVIDFLQSVHEDDTFGSRVVKWPVATAAEIEAVKEGAVVVVIDDGTSAHLPIQNTNSSVESSILQRSDSTSRRLDSTPPISLVEIDRFHEELALEGGDLAEAFTNFVSTYTDTERR